MVWYYILIISVLWREKKVYFWVLLAIQASLLSKFHASERLIQKRQEENGVEQSMKVSGANIGKSIYFRIYMIYDL